MVFYQLLLVDLTELNGRGGECKLFWKAVEVSVQIETSVEVNAFTLNLRGVQCNFPYIICIYMWMKFAGVKFVTLPRVEALVTLLLDLDSRSKGAKPRL